MALEITYRFGFDDNRQEVFTFLFEEQSMRLIMKDEPAPEPWTELGFQQCKHCILNAEEHSHCPAALALQPSINTLGKGISYTEIELEVTTKERKTKMRTDLSSAFASMMGLIIPTSGCPYAIPFRPMARFHLPLASGEETAFRAISAYLLGQHLRRKHELSHDDNLEGLTAIYNDLEKVNSQLAIRLVKSGKLRELNSLVKLDTHAKTVPLIIEDAGKEFEKLFEYYLKA